MLKRRTLFFVALLAVTGCTQTARLLNPPDQVAEPVGLVAVLPIDRDPGATPERLPPDVERIVTAHIYGVLADSSHWRFVPDVTVGDALTEVNPVYVQDDRAQALGEAVEADAVICGTVSRFVERDGSDFGADEPASVAFRLKLVSTASGEVLWEGEFDETQQSLSGNLLNFWQFWRGGPRWFSAAEFSRMGVERLLEDLEARTP